MNANADAPDRRPLDLCLAASHRTRTARSSSSRQPARDRPDADDARCSSAGSSTTSSRRSTIPSEASRRHSSACSSSPTSAGRRRHPTRAPLAVEQRRTLDKHARRSTSSTRSRRASTRGARRRAAIPGSSSTRSTVTRLHRPDRPAADAAASRLVDYKTSKYGHDARRGRSRTSSSRSTRSPAARCPSCAELGERLRARLPLPARLVAYGTLDAPQPDRDARVRRPDARAHPRRWSREIAAEQFDFSPRGRLHVVRVQADLPSSPRGGRAAVTAHRTSSGGSSTARTAPLRIAAGAGTGKTGHAPARDRRADRGRGARPGEILCLTFTVEATEGDAPSRPRRARPTARTSTPTS